MKKQYVLAALLVGLALAPSGFAQKKSKASGASKSSAHADAKLADLTTKLTLTDEEKAKIKPILDDESAKIHVVKMDKSLSDDDKKAKTKPIREDATKQIRAVLTPQQATIYDTIAKKGGKDGEKKHGGKKSAAAPAAAPTA